MRKALTLMAALGIALIIGSTPAYADGGSGAGSGYSFFYQWFADSDGDGIPNAQDEDWVRPLDGTGFMHQLGNNASQLSSGDGTGSLFQYMYEHQLENKGETTGKNLFQRIFEHACGTK